MKKRLIQYISLILIIILIGAVTLPISTYAVQYTSYKIGYESDNIEEGTILIPDYSSIQVSSNVHSMIYMYDYSYTGEYDKKDAKMNEWDMSGNIYSIGSTSNQKYVWQVKKIDSDSNIYIQEVDSVSVENLKDVNILKGATASFTVNITKTITDNLNYQWYSINKSGQSVSIKGANSNILTINQNDELYISGTKFYCNITSNDYEINKDTNQATLVISDGYNLTYKSNDGKETIDTDLQKYIQGEKVQLNFENIKAKENCEFIGWSDVPNSTVPKYTKAESKFVMPSSNTELYAVFNITKITNSQTKTTVQGKFSYNSVLNVVKIEDSKNEYKNLKLKLKSDETIICSYEVSINGIYSGNVEITFTIDEKYNNKEITVYHQKADNTTEELKAIAKDGKVIINVSELSPFMLAVNDESTNNTVQNIVTQSNISQNAPKTGDNIFVMAGILVITISIITVLKRIKK